MPGILDHLLILLIVVGAPIDGIFERRKLIRAHESGVPDAKFKAYARIMSWQWGSAAVLLAYWWLRDRPLADLGLRGMTASGFTWALATCALVTIVMVAQERSLRRRPDGVAQVRRQAASLAFLLPMTAREVTRFSWLGVTAGIVEELLVRGFIMWYCMAFMPPWAAVVLSSVVFGVGHAYQGVTGVVKTTVAGLFFGALYRMTGALWAPMYIHATVDVMSGRLVYFAFQHDESAEKPDAA